MATAAIKNRKIVVNIATSADGYVARPDGDLEWLTSRPTPKGFYGMGQFMQSVDAKVLGRKTYEVNVQLGATFDRHYVFSRQPPPASAPAGVEFINDAIRAFAKRLKQEKGKNIWLMGGGDIIASFLDEGAIDEFIVSIVPVFIGEGIPLIAPRHRNVLLHLHSVKPFPDGVVQVHYGVRKGASMRTQLPNMRWSRRTIVDERDSPRCAAQRRSLGRPNDYLKNSHTSHSNGQRSPSHPDRSVTAIHFWRGVR